MEKSKNVRELNIDELLQEIDISEEQIEIQGKIYGTYKLRYNECVQELRRRLKDANK